MGAEKIGVLEALSGRKLLLTGATGFIGKVTLALLLDRRPDVGRVFVLVRAKGGKSAVDRFFEAILGSPVLDPLRERYGENLEAFLRERVEVIEGDAAEPGWAISEADKAKLKGLDLVVNVAGLVSLNPALDESLKINAHGARHGAALAVELGAKLLHVSTCYVAGYRSGRVREDERILGYYPRRKGLGAFDAAAELAAADRFVIETRAKAASGRKARAAKRWTEETLIAEGRRRARRWGWPNIYCFTKSMGEQLVAATPGLSYAIVRPSIVESALQFPLPGWNEGMTTSAPVILAMCTGHVLWPAHSNAALDVVPVDLVAGGLLAAAGALILGRHETVYHLGSSDLNPLSVRRCMRFVGAYRRRHYRDHAQGALWTHWLRTRLRLRTVPGWAYKAFGVPAYRRAIDALSGGLEAVGRKPPRALKSLSRELAGVEHVVETFYPFIHDIDCVFETRHMSALAARAEDMPPWSCEKIDWRSYWFDVHMEGLRKWVFPGFQDKVRAAWRRRPMPVRWIRSVLGQGQRLLYGWYFRTRTMGREHVPHSGAFLIAANHESHLDMGLIKHALGHREIVSLAAKDYFFDTPWKAFFFATFTNLLPFNRKTRLKESLQAAGQVLADGRPLLLFPEGTRTKDGKMLPFKASLGYLALNNGVPVLPVFIDGAFEAMPKGVLIPRRKTLRVHIGAIITHSELEAVGRGLPNSEAYRAATAHVEAAVRRLAGRNETRAAVTDLT